MKKIIFLTTIFFAFFANGNNVIVTKQAQKINASSIQFTGDDIIYTLDGLENTGKIPISEIDIIHFSNGYQYKLDKHVQTKSFTIALITISFAICMLLIALYFCFHNNPKKEIVDETLSPENIEMIKQCYLGQLKEKKEYGAGWDFWDERLQMENLLCQRFNYLLMGYSLFIAAFAMVGDRISKLIILGIGFIVLLLISLFIKRAWVKFDYNLKVIFVLQEGFNGVKFIDQNVFRTLKWPDTWLIKIKYNRLIGIYIPIIMWSSFGLGFLAILFNLWKV